MLRVQIDRSRCIGAGNCINLAPTAFDWLRGDHSKVDVADTGSVEEELLHHAAISCPTRAITLEDIQELLPWQLRGRAMGSRRVVKTFMFTDIEKSTNLVAALGDEAWEGILGWHDAALRELFNAHEGDEVSATGDGFFVGFDSPEAAVACAIAIQRRLAEHRRQAGFAPAVRIGVHASGATQIGKNFAGRGVHEAARIAALAGGGEIVASRDTVAGTRFPASEPRSVTLRGLEEPVEIVTVDWR
jgi:class 3 adenylate cyclase